MIPKMTFTRFEGDNPRIWKDKCLEYFTLFDLPPSLWTSMASLNMDGRAAKWLQVYKQKNGLSSWDTFIQAVESKFGENDYREALTMLLELQHTDALETYISTFEDLQYHLIMHNSGLDDLFFVTQFIKGLKPEIGGVVQTQVHETLERAILLAKIQQQVADKNKQKGLRNSNWNKTPNAKPEVKGAQPTNALWKERQVRDFRKANGLCFYCGEPFDANHRNACSKRPQNQAQVNALVVNDLDVLLTDDILNHLAVEDALAEEFCQLSLNALSGTESGQSMKIRALVKNKLMLILVDSGSSHSFVSTNFLNTVGIPAVPASPKNVKLANGGVMITDKRVPKLEWWANGHTLNSNMRVLELGAYDAILGYFF